MAAQRAIPPPRVVRWQLRELSRPMGPDRGKVMLIIAACSGRRQRPGGGFLEDRQSSSVSRDDTNEGSAPRNRCNERRMREWNACARRHSWMRHVKLGRGGITGRTATGMPQLTTDCACRVTSAVTCKCVGRHSACPTSNKRDHQCNLSRQKNPPRSLRGRYYFLRDVGTSDCRGRPNLPKQQHLPAVGSRCARTPWRS